MNYPEELLIRIKDRTNKGAINECWPWTGSYTVGKIPVLKFKQATIYPRRVLFEIENSLTLSENIKSTCNNKQCVNPEHHQLKSVKFTKGITDLDIERFLSKTLKKDDCLEWIGFKNPNGYGSFRINYKVEYAHRVAYAIKIGVSLDYLKNKVIMHSCDNPSCVNPDHLEEGSQQDNIDDCIKKNRHSFPSTKNVLDQNLIEEIKNLRSKKTTLRNIAQQLDVKYSTVVYVVYNK